MTNNLQIISDVGRTFTAKASAVVSGGYLLKAHPASTDAVASTGGYAWDDISVQQTDSTLNCCGIALNDAASGTEVTVAMDGIFILQAGSSAVSGGFAVQSAGYGDMVIYRITGSAAERAPKIGTALTTATSLTGYAVVRLRV